MTSKEFKPLSTQSIKKVLGRIEFDQNGLVPVIVQQYNTGAVLMMAWMNDNAITDTLKTGRICYYSRSRNSLWRKGEQSGQTQKLKDFRFDCDGDAILLLVEQTGVARHTGRQNCFFNAVRGKKIPIIEEIKIQPRDLYRK